MAESNTTWKTYPCKLKYAKVFNENMETGLDREGNPIEADWAQTIRDRGGKWSVDMCVSDAVKSRMIADGIPPVILGWEQFHPDDEFEGYPWRYSAKRYVVTPFKDEDGKTKLNEPPALGNLKEIYEDDTGQRRATLWTHDDGLIGNGTDAQVTLSIYTKGKKCVVTLQKVGLVDVVPYEEGELVMF